LIFPLSIPPKAGERGMGGEVFQNVALTKFLKSISFSKIITTKAGRTLIF